MKKLLFFAFVLIFLLSFVTAWEWDNVKDYDALNKEVTITNSLGLGSDIAKVKLLSELNVNVIPGKNRKVAELELWINQDFLTDYNTAFKQSAGFEFYNLKNGMAKINRPITMKYAKKIEIIYNPTYETTCEKNGKLSVNGSEEQECITKLISNETIERVIEWADFSELSKLSNPVKIALFTNVYEGDKVEWVPELFGIKIEEWASWTAGYNNGLAYYYRMNQTSVAETNIIGAYGELALTPTLTTVTGGMYTNAIKYASGSNTLCDSGCNIVDHINTTTGTVNLWLNWSWQSANIYGFLMFDDGSLFNPSIIIRFDTRASTGLPDNRRYLFSIDVNNGGAFTMNGANNSLLSFNNSGWHMITINQNGSQVSWYLDGVIQTDNNFVASSNKAYGFRNLINEGGNKFSIDTRGLGGYARFVGEVDEWMIWNRSLSDTEIFDLYNSGLGLFWGIPIDETESITTTLISPINNFMTTSQQINFTANISVTGDSNVTNATIYVWDVANNTDYTELKVITGKNITNVTRFSYNSFDEGAYRWNVKGCGFNSTGGMCDYGDSNFTFSIDLTAPTITGVFNLSTLVTESFVNSTWWFNVSDVNLNACWYYTSDSATNITTTCNGQKILTQWGTEGIKTLTYCVNDSVNFRTCGSSSIRIMKFTTSQTESKDFIGEGDSVTYSLYINMSDIDVFDLTNASLTLNATNYYASKFSAQNYTLFTYTHTFNNISGSTAGLLHYWNWTFNIRNSSTILGAGSTITSNTTVYELSIDDCATNKVVILNYTLYDEEYRSNTDPISLGNQTIEADVFIRKGALEWEYAVKKNVTNNLIICVPYNLLNNTDYSLDSTVRYKAQDHVVEFNYIDNYNLSSATQQLINLYDLYSETDRAEYSTSFLVNYQDENYLPVNDAIIDLWRYYVGSGVFISVEHGLTDEDGNTRLHMVTEDVIYKIIVRIDGVIDFTSNDFVALCQTQPCQINLQKESDISPVGNYSQIDNLNYQVTLNKDTRTVTLTYSTIDGSSANVYLNVTRWDAYLNTTVCTDISTSSGGTLTCTVPYSAQNITYLIQAYKDNLQLPIYTFSLGSTPMFNFGYTGVILMALLFLTLVLMAISGGGIAVISFGLLGIIFGSLLAIFDGGSILGVGSAIMWLIIAGVILITKLANRRGG